MPVQVGQVLADITTLNVDAIVNAANPTLRGGGGVDGAIHRAAGPDLLAECMAFPAEVDGVRCPVGQVRVTQGYNLPAKWVLHTVGPMYPQGRPPVFVGELQHTTLQADLLLAEAARNCLAMAQSMLLQSIAFPAISCGVYGGNVMTWARIMQSVLAEKEDWGSLEIVIMVLHTEDDLEAFKLGWFGFPDEEDPLTELF